MDRSPAKSFRDLGVWQKAHEFVLGMYRLTARFPQQETYGLTAQMRRAAVAVPANYLILARDLSYGEDDQLPGLAEDVARLLAAYSRKLLTPVG